MKLSICIQLTTNRGDRYILRTSRRFRLRAERFPSISFYQVGCILLVHAGTQPPGRYYGG